MQLAQLLHQHHDPNLTHEDAHDLLTLLRELSARRARHMLPREPSDETTNSGAPGTVSNGDGSILEGLYAISGREHVYGGTDMAHSDVPISFGHISGHADSAGGRPGHSTQSNIHAGTSSRGLEGTPMVTISESQYGVNSVSETGEGERGRVDTGTPGPGSGTKNTAL